MRRITWLGHATVLLEVAGARLLTDPVLRRHVAHLRRRVPLPPDGLTDGLDGVLISHVHHDHLDRPSLHQLAREETVAVVPIWGWGPSLGPGHLDPESAARAVALVAPSVVVPIHWGTFLPFGTGHRHDDVLSAPAQAFAAQVAGAATGVRVATLAPGETLSL
jgi:L-ascorbate metabolism protein UlaG (beta-lactamase superfamily)